MPFIISDVGSSQSDRFHFICELTCVEKIPIPDLEVQLLKLNHFYAFRVNKCSVTCIRFVRKIRKFVAKFKSSFWHLQAGL